MMLTRYLRTVLPFLALIVFTTTAPSQTAPSTVKFSGQTINTGPNPSGVVSGDFNEDGRPDLAVIDNLSNDVQILLNDGGGHFSLGSQTNTGSSPGQIVVGNFNSDTHLDLAVVNTVDHSLTILLGHGDGTFSAAPGAPTFDGFAEALIGANLRNDGLTQLVLIRCTLPGLQCFLDIYQPNSQAAFSLAQSISVPIGANFQTIVTDDFDLDNKPDIAVGVGTEIIVFRNTGAFNGIGSAHLTQLTSFNSPNLGLIGAVTSGHFNAGAAPDLAFEVFDPVSNPDELEPPHTVYVFLNTGTGTFFRKQTITGSFLNSGSFKHQLAVSDINGDGIQDLIIMELVGNEGMEYELGRGDGTFGALQPVTALANGRGAWMITRDMNRDSLQDIIVASAGIDLGPDDGFAEVMLNQNALANCPSPGSDIVRVKICSATTGTDSLTVKASGNSPSGVKRVELWIDGTKRTQAFSDQLGATVAVAAGMHCVTLVAVDLYDKLAKEEINVTIP
jgi:FG-GAP-like repeat